MKIQEILRVSVESNHQTDEILKKFSLWKALLIKCGIRSFTKSCRKPSKERIRGPLTTVEMEKEKHHLIKIGQRSCENKTWFQEHQLILNLQRNTNGMYECRGRKQGDYPVYIPKDSLLAEKIVQEAHIRTIHGGVSLTIGEVRKNYWIPKLGGLGKKIKSNCFSCKIFQITASANPPPGALPLDRTVGNRAFQVIGVDYAGPLYYRISPTKKGKADILLFSCSLTRAIHLQLLKEQTTNEIIRSLKILIARGFPRYI